MKSLISSLLLILSVSGFAQKIEIRYLFVKNKSDVSFNLAVDSSRSSFSIKKFNFKNSKNKNEIELVTNATYFGFSHRKTTRIKALPLVTLEDYYANPSNFILSDRIYIIIPLVAEKFAIWKCSILKAK